MRHDNKYQNKALFEIGNILGLKKEDIIELKKAASNQEYTQNVTVLSPADSYNSSGGYYGTVSIKDF